MEIWTCLFSPAETLAASEPRGAGLQDEWGRASAIGEMNNCPWRQDGGGLLRYGLPVNVTDTLTLTAVRAELPTPEDAQIKGVSLTSGLVRVGMNGGWSRRIAWCV